MGDGVSDLAARNEGSEKDSDEYILHCIEAGGGEICCNRNSVFLGYHFNTVKRLKAAGRIFTQRRGDWLTIRSQRGER